MTLLPRTRTRTHTPSFGQPVHIVSSGGAVEQVFANLDDAERFAVGIPDASVSCYQVRESVDDAVIIFDRRVVVAAGTTVLDRTEVVRQFIDSPYDTPDPADVEWFHDATESRWHIAGFGMDKELLDEKMQNAIERVTELSHVTPLKSAR